LEVGEREADRVVVAVESGLARFRVRHDPARVFRVHGGDVEVEDVGTTFEVENKLARAIDTGSRKYAARAEILRVVGSVLRRVSISGPSRASAECG
jgi:hypothetical protein